MLVALEKDKIHTYVHLVSRSEACEQAAAVTDTSNLTLTHAEISPASVGGPLKQAGFEVGYGYEGPRCNTERPALRFDEFQPAKIEFYEPRQRKEAVPLNKR